ncbi:hypothetical protein KLEP7_gp55 [Pseudaeromonas phage vB_PpeM_ KLEP7]|nr:hypothetical protein KLEP7_gp55 [Pseudaeromonas phage vB_PpeM_ KLEP7]
MSIDNKAVLMVGLPAKEVGVDEDEFWGKLEPSGWVRASPYYDAPFSACLIGLPLRETSCYLNLASWPTGVEEASHLFGEVFGKKPNIILAVHID